MGQTLYFAWEPALMAWLQQAMGPVLTRIMSFITEFGEETVIILVLGLLYWCLDKEYAKKVAVNLVTALVLNSMLKNLWMRRRPYMDHEEIRCLKPVDRKGDIYDLDVQGYSLPSGHSVNSVIIYGSLAHYRKKKALIIVAAALPILVGCSRVFLGVHYPTDVLAGWTLGALVMFGISKLEQTVKRPVLHLALVLLALPGAFYCRSNDYYTGLGIMIGFFLAIPFEERFVHFKDVSFDSRKGYLWVFLRLIGGLVVYLALNTLLKLPFPKDFLEQKTLLPLLIRTARYAVVIFAAIGVYPMAFRYIER